LKIALHSVSLSGFFYKGEAVPLKELIPLVKDFGYDGLELMAKRPHANPMDLSNKVRKEIREQADSYSIELPILAAYPDFSGPDMFRRELNLLYMKEVIKLATDLDIDKIRIFAAGMKSVSAEIPYEKQWKLCRDAIKEVAKWAEEYGVTLALQNHPPVIESYKDVMAMIEEVGIESLKACIDPELLVWTGDIRLQEGDLEAKLREIYNEVKDYLVHIHIGDSIFRPGTLVWVPGTLSMLRSLRLERAKLGEGVFRVLGKPFIKTLKTIGYSSYISYEMCAPRYIKHELVTKEEVMKEAKSGAEYLRKLISES